jgi:hypothetical protein
VQTSKGNPNVLQNSGQRRSAMSATGSGVSSGADDGNWSEKRTYPGPTGRSEVLKKTIFQFMNLLGLEIFHSCFQ